MFVFQSLANQPSDGIFYGVVDHIEVCHLPGFQKNVTFKEVNVYHLGLSNGPGMLNLNALSLQLIEFSLQHEILYAKEFHVIRYAHESLNRFSRRLLKIALKTSISVVAGRFRLMV